MNNESTKIQIERKDKSDWWEHRAAVCRGGDRSAPPLQENQRE